jgi:hypothetical protein
MPEIDEDFDDDDENHYADGTVPVVDNAEGMVEDISGEIHKSIQEATVKLRTDLLKATGLKAGDPALERMKKVWDSMDSIGNTTSCTYLFFRASLVLGLVMLEEDVCVASCNAWEGSLHMMFLAGLCTEKNRPFLLDPPPIPPPPHPPLLLGDARTVLIGGP